VSARPRLQLTPSQQIEVAHRAPCCLPCVRRWLHGVDGTPAIDAGIVRAIAELGLVVDRWGRAPALPPPAPEPVSMVAIGNGE
jgi:hypothetical protein